MTIRVVADTHAILWYLYNDSRLSKMARETMDAVEQDGERIAIASITLAEIVYLTILQFPKASPSALAVGEFWGWRKPTS